MAGAYVLDKIFDPPVAPLEVPWADIDNESEKDALSEYFTKPLSSGWSIVYRQSNPDSAHMFLCLNWALHRLDDDLKPGQKFPDTEGAMETTPYTVDEMTNFLKKHDLVPCEPTDKDRIVVIWSDKGWKGQVGHIQVKYKGHWESKLSRHLWVITHGEDDFVNFADFDLQRTGTYKRKN